MEQDKRNVVDKYKGWLLELIREDVAAKTFPYAVMMDHLSSDFNISTVIRNVNAFGAKGLFYIGEKKIDMRGAVGCNHYSPVKHLKSLEEVEDLFVHYTPVALECGIDAVPMPDFIWPDNPIIVVGNECDGIRPELLDMCKHKVVIPMFGSVRSLNVGTAAGIAMNDFVTKYKGACAVV